MAIQIRNLSDSVEIQFNADRSRRIAHGHIVECNAKRILGTSRYDLVIKTSDGETFRFKYSDVSLPVTADANTLANIILSYNSGGGNKKIFYATAGQDVFDMGTIILGSNVDVYVGGVLMALGYTWTPGTSTVTFSTPFSGGEEVIIASR